MKVLVISFDKRPRYKTLIQYLEESGILYDFLQLSNSGLVSDLQKIKQTHKTTKATHTILIGFDKTAIIWAFICSLFGYKRPIIRLGGDPIKVPYSRIKHKKQHFTASLKQKLRLSILKIALRIPNEFITVSKSLSVIDSLVNKNCFIQPVFPQLLSTAPKQHMSNSTTKLLTITNLNYYEKYQGVLHIIKSAEIASQSHPIILSIVGDGDYLPQLKQDIEKYRQDNMTIVVAGHTDNVAPYYIDANIFVYHSALDSWPNVLMEAMAHGLPIIANNNQQFSEVFCEKQKKFLCISEDEQSLIQTLLNFINNSETYDYCAKLSILRANELRSDKKKISSFKIWLQKIN